MEGEEREQEIAAGGGVLVGRHLSKRSRKNKGLVIVFDANARKEFVTGFHKRKKKRRKLAEHQKKLKERQIRLQERRERRLALAEAITQSQAGAAEGGSVELLSDQNESAETGAQNGTVMYEDEDTTTIVNTYSIDMNDDLASHNHLGHSKAIASLPTTMLKKTVKKLPQTNQKSSGKKRKQSSSKKGKHVSKGKKRRS